jgi:hypothetical protein
VVHVPGHTLLGARTFVMARCEYEHLGFDIWYPLLIRSVVTIYRYFVNRFDEIRK